MVVVEIAPHRRKRKQHHHVGGGERVAREVVALRDLAVDEGEHLPHAVEHARAHRTFLRLGNARDHQRDQHQRHEAAFREMHPVDVVRVFGRVRRDGEAAAAVLLHDVFHDRARLRQHAIAIADHRRLAERV